MTGTRIPIAGFRGLASRPLTGGRMKIAYWVLLVIAVALGIFGFVRDMQWLIFVGVAILLVAIAVDPKRSFFGRRKNT
jgi:hypothetical protein